MFSDNTPIEQEIFVQTNMALSIQNGPWGPSLHARYEKGMSTFLMTW